MRDTHTTPRQSTDNARLELGTAIFAVVSMAILYHAFGGLATGLFVVSLLSECIMMRLQGIRPE